MRIKSVAWVIVSFLLVAGCLFAIPCGAETDTPAEVETEIETEKTTVDVAEEETGVDLLIPEISWWARMVAAIGLGPLAVMAGVVLAMVTSGVVIAIVCLRDRSKRKKQESTMEI